jgi:hypothetical protein
VQARETLLLLLAATPLCDFLKPFVPFFVGKILRKALFSVMVRRENKYEDV